MRRLSILLVAALFACAGPKEATRTGGTTRAGDTKPAGPDISNRAQLLFEDAVKAFDAQKKAKSYDWPALERKFQAALDADRDLAEAEYNLGVIAERQGKTDRAISHYRNALRKKPSLRQAAENLAVVAQNTGDTGAAMEIYKDILDKYPDDASSRARLAELYRRQGNHEQAMDLAREALLREPKTLNAYKVMMRSYVDRRQLSMAKLVALRALKLDDSDPELYHTVGMLLLAEKDPVQARLQFVKAVEVRPDYLPAHVELAKIALELEDYEGAEQSLRRVLQADGKNAEAHLNLGVAYKGLGQFDKAMQEYDEAEKLNPELAPVFLNKAIVLHRHKDAPERGLELYKKYVALSGQGVLSEDDPVMGLIKEAETLIQAKAEAAAAAKQMEAEQKALEAQQAQGKPEGETKPAAGGAEGGQTQPASGGEAQKPPPPAKEQPKADEPKNPDEPSDDL